MPGSKSSRCRREASTARVPPPPRARNTAVCCHCKIGQGGHPCARRRRDRARGAHDGPNVRQRQNDDIADARRQGGALPRPSPTLAATVSRGRQRGDQRLRTARAHLVSRHPARSEEHTSELQSLRHLVCRLLLEKKKKKKKTHNIKEQRK